MSRPVRTRRAFTLIELLVVMAVISVLVGMLLPAVQKAREAASRIKCANNLKQLALAVHNFESERGYVQSSIRNGETGRQGWALYILPYIEQMPVYTRFDFTKGWNEGVNNRNIIATRLAMFQCPSVPEQYRLDGAPDDPTWTEFAATTDYAAITGVDCGLVGTGMVAVTDTRGVLARDARTKFTDITDGLSNTLLIVESAGRPQVWQYGHLLGQMPQNRVNGGGWCRPASDFDLKGSSYDGKAPFGPCAINCMNGGDTQGQYPHPLYGVAGSGETYAFHTSGANVALADGSVRLIRANIPIKTYAALVTRMGGEIVADID
jgi:prepilin-type N-terminal cleavage/methylation domain-containing protein/prepilin-type processing-associated H-X9-DG protein